MPNTVQICNLALAKLGATRITSLYDGSKQAGVMSAIYEMQRDAELAAHPWSFAIVRAQLPASSTAPVFGWSLAYPLPTDCLKVVQVGDDWAFYDAGETGALFDVEGGAIVTDQSSPLSIRYVYRVTNPGLFPPMFVESLACRLAIQGAESLTQNLSKRQDLKDDYRDAIRNAKRANDIERPPQRVPDSSWVRAMTLGTEG